MKRIYKSVIRAYKNIKLRHKLLLTYAFVALLPIMVLGLFCYEQTKTILMDHEKGSMQDCVEQAALSVKNQMEIYDNLSDYVAYNQTIGQVVSYKYDTAYERYEKLTDILDPMLASLKYFHNNVNQVTIYTSNDFVKHDTTIAPITLIEDSGWYQELMNTSSRNILWFVNEKEKKVFSARIMPSLEDSGYPGVLYIDVEYDALFAPLKEMTSDTFGVYVAEENGSRIYSYETGLEKGTAGNVKELLKENLQGASEYTVVKNTISSGWTVFLYKPNHAIMHSVVNIAVITIVVMGCCLLASLLATTVISKVMVSDIEKLTENMRQVQTGNMEITVTSNSKDEVGNLIRGFGMMIERIHILINEVYEGEIAQKEYEMKALQAQINPHFLYNTLSLINWRAIEAKEPEISRITLLLSSFYRTALNRGDNILSVKDELTNMKAYLEIQLIMHEQAFDVVFNIPEELNQYQTLNLILQPVVENAIVHGIDLLTDRRGVISISGRLVHATIQFIVEDNGVGMEESKCSSILTKKSKGYGIRNVNERIKLLYGQQYGLEVSSIVGEGTRIVITMPAIKEV